MASISVDVDLEDFDLNEILEELEDRYNSYYNSGKNKKIINDFIVRMKIDCEQDFNVNNLSLIDRIKLDFLISNIDKIKLNDLERLI